MLHWPVNDGQHEHGGKWRKRIQGETTRTNLLPSLVFVIRMITWWLCMQTIKCKLFEHRILVRGDEFIPCLVEPSEGGEVGKRYMSEYFKYELGRQGLERIHGR